MRTHITRLLTTLVCFSYSTLYSQRIGKPAAKIIDGIDALSTQRLDGKARTKYVSPFIFAKIFSNLQNSINGIAIKDGKTVATSAVVDDKSLTINYSNKKWSTRKLTPQLTLAGTAKDGIVDIFSLGKYNKVFTGGLNINFFPQRNGGKFDQSLKRKLWFKLKTQIEAFKLIRESVADRYSLLIDSLKKINDVYNSLQKGNVARIANVDPLNCSLEQVQFLQDSITLLAGYLTQGLDLENQQQVTDLLSWAIANKSKVAGDLADRQNLAVLDSLQLNAPWTSLKFSWFSLSLKYNNGNYPVFSPNEPDAIFTRNYTDNYLSASIGWNRLIVKNNANVLIAPALKFQNSRAFDADDSLYNYQQGEHFIFGSDTLLLTKSTAFYKTIPGRDRLFTFDFPLTFYFVRKGWGIDVAAGTTFSGTLNNLYARVGIFLSIFSDAATNVLIEPIIKVNKLNKGNLDFFKEQFSFGINLSVSLPKFVSGE